MLTIGDLTISDAETEVEDNENDSDLESRVTQYKIMVQSTALERVTQVFKVFTTLPKNSWIK